MDQGEEQRLIDRAQMQIAQILATLERDTGMLVQKVCIQSIEVTTLSDANPQYVQSVRIDMYRLPGHGW